MLNFIFLIDFVNFDNFLNGFKSTHIKVQRNIHINVILNNIYYI